MVRLGVAVGVLLLSSAPALAAEDWKADGPTCTGVYDALYQKKSDLLLMSAEARGAANFEKIDYSARAGDQRLTVGVPDYQASDWESYSDNFVMMILKGSIDSDPKPIRTVLDVAARCDAKYGFKPALSLASQSPPKPAPSPPPKPGPPPVAKPPALPVVDDKVCAVSYLALSFGNGANPSLAGALLQRADGAGGRYLAANPNTDRQAFITETRGAAEARVKAILIDKKAPVEPLFAEVVACDQRYGLPPPPQ